MFRWLRRLLLDRETKDGLKDIKRSCANLAANTTDPTIIAGLFILSQKVAYLLGERTNERAES